MLVIASQITQSSKYRNPMINLPVLQIPLPPN